MVSISNVSTVEHGAAVAPAEKPAAALSLAEQIRADATRIEREKDAIGRMIAVKKLTFLDVHRTTKLLGADSSNSVALEQALMAASVVEIDGEPITRPVNTLQLEALMGRLDFHGIAAANRAVARYGFENAKDEAAEIKNS
jgi:hypothetical protein